MIGLQVYSRLGQMFDADDPLSLSNNWSDLETTQGNNQQHLNHLSSIQRGLVLQCESFVNKKILYP